MKVTKILVISLTVLLLSCFILPSTQSSIAGDQVIITEVFYDTPGTDSIEEWFELYNPTDSDVNITDWIAADNYDSFNLTGVIPAKGYFVVAINATGFFDLYGYNANQTGGWNNVAFSNSGDRLTLTNNESVEVDYVAWEGGDAEWSTLSAYHTTIRRINGTDTDVVGDWEDSASIGDPGFGDYVVIIPEFSQLSVTLLALLGVSAIFSLSFYKRKLK